MGVLCGSARYTHEHDQDECSGQRESAAEDKRELRGARRIPQGTAQEARGQDEQPLGHAEKPERGPASLGRDQVADKCLSDALGGTEED